MTWAEGELKISRDLNTERHLRFVFDEEAKILVEYWETKTQPSSCQ